MLDRLSPTDYTGGTNVKYPTNKKAAQKDLKSHQFGALGEPRRYAVFNYSAQIFEASAEENLATDN